MVLAGQIRLVTALHRMPSGHLGHFGQTRQERMFDTYRDVPDESPAPFSA